MSQKVNYHNGSFRGLRVTQEDHPLSGCSLDFLAFLTDRAERRPASLPKLDPNLQQLLAFYRDCFTKQQA